MTEDSDDTVLIPRGRAAGPSRRWRLPVAAVCLVLAATAAGGVWYEFFRPPPAPLAVAPAPATQPVAVAVVQPPHALQQPPRLAIVAPPLATEAEILADAPNEMKIYRFAPQPAIVVLQFPTLAAQARMLNRAAALLEKNGFPRDRLLDDAELDRRIRDSGSSPETFYYGHDYRAADLVRFFAMADQAGTALTPEERRLHGLIGEWGWRDGPVVGALISLARFDPEAGLDSQARATILRHELSHGAYFTTPAYAAYALRFWEESLSARDRALFTAFLARDGYDPGLSDLMVNEAQAYLMHTVDRRFFSAGALGMPEARLDVLRGAFLTGMPPGWLRDCTTLPGAALAIPVRAPRQRPGGPAQRQVQRRGLVRTRSTDAETRRLCRAAASRAGRRSRR